MRATHDTSVVAVLIDADLHPRRPRPDGEPGCDPPLRPAIAEVPPDSPGHSEACLFQCHTRSPKCRTSRGAARSPPPAFGAPSDQSSPNPCFLPPSIGILPNSAFSWRQDVPGRRRIPLPTLELPRVPGVRDRPHLLPVCSPATVSPGVAIEGTASSGRLLAGAL
jgi:hypothetical protein